MCIRIRHLLLIAVASFGLTPALCAQRAFLGVLEEVPGVYVGDPSHRAVRTVFEKNGSTWSPLPSNCPDQKCLSSISTSYPHEVKWTVTFDGKKLGEITGQTPAEFKFYSHIGLQEITGSGPVPTIGKRSAEYGGFLDAAVYRPLVANSQPYFTDPEKWSPADPNGDLTHRLRLEFRKKFQKVTNCLSPEQDAAKPWAYLDSNIIIAKVYSSALGWFIAAVQLNEYRCDGPPDSPFIDQWFAVSPEGTIKFLDEGIWLVDAGDYDNDGRSELVFSIDRYNRGGYELFYDDFKKVAKFQYLYH